MKLKSVCLPYIIMCMMGNMHMTLASSESCKSGSMQDQWLCENIRDYNLAKLQPNQVHFTQSQSNYLQTLNDFDHPTTVVNKSSKRRKRQASSQAIRRELRTLSDTEWSRLIQAMNALKHRQIDGTSKWDLIVQYHTPQQAAGAHWGPAFLPWHREYVRLFEVALRLEDSSVAVPFWDTSLDARLPDPRDSVVWTEHLMGNGNGHVTVGPFAHWPISHKLHQKTHVNSLYRQLGTHPVGQLMNSSFTNWMQQEVHNYSQLTFCDDQRFELTHGWTHVWVGGYMTPLFQSPNDPIFFVYHSYIDYLWELFRQKEQTIEERETEYGTLLKWPKCVRNEAQGLYRPMKPFSHLTNSDGLSNNYTDQWYRHVRSPSHCLITHDCHSKYLFCHFHLKLCTSKVAVGGNCTGLNETWTPCYESECVQSVCAPGSNNASEIDINGLTSEHGVSMEYPTVWLKLFIWQPTQLNASEYGAMRVRAHGLNYNGTTNAYVTQLMPKVDRFGSYEGSVFIQVRQPNPVTDVRFVGTDSFGRACTTYCLLPDQKYQECNGQLRLYDTYINGQQSYMHNVAFTHSPLTSHYLDMDLSGNVVRTAVNRWWPDMAAPVLYHTAPYVYFQVNLLNSTNQSQPIESVLLFAHDLSSKSDAKRVFNETMSYRRSSTNSRRITVKVRNPLFHGHPIELYVVIRAGLEGKLWCSRMCNSDLHSNSTNNQSINNKNCPNTIVVAPEPENCDPLNLALTPDKRAVGLLGWDLRGHPSHWTKQRSRTLTFIC